MSIHPVTATLDEVGGKAASLLRMRDRGMPVPAFFVVPTSEHARSLNGALAADARNWVARQLASIAPEGEAVAVRSSGVDEDGAEDSFAGIFETFLNVRGVDAVVEAIEACWASHGSNRAQSYREAKTLEHVAVGMAVVVQRMVNADWSGVVFTADPVRSALSVVSVSATRGLGEDLVSGLINPEEITVDASTREVLSRLAAPGEPHLPDRILDEVVELSLEVAVTEDFPQDVEWACEGDDVYLLQNRPITTVTDVVHARPLEPWAEDPTANPDAPDRTWSRAFADETWTPPVSPLFYDIQNLTGLVCNQISRNGDRKVIPADLFKYHRAAAYLEVESIERMYRSLPPSMRTAGILNMLPAERREPFAAEPWDWRGRLQRHAHFEIKHRQLSVRAVYRRLSDAWEPFTTATKSWSGVRLEELDDEGLEAFADDIRAVAGTIGPDCAVAVTYHSVDARAYLTEALERWCRVDGPRTYAEVTSGLEKSETVAEANSIHAIATAVRAASRPEGFSELTLAEARASGTQLGLEDALAAFDGFLAEHGHRGANYKDIIFPRWGDDAEGLWRLVCAHARTDAESPAVRHRRAAHAREERQAELLAALRGPLGAMRRVVLRRLLAINEIYAALRDNHRFHYDRVWWAWRRYYLERGRRLVLQHRLQEAADVFFLGRAEIDQLAARSNDSARLQARIASRRREWERTRTVAPPKYIRDGYAPFDDTDNDSGSFEMSGLGVSPGDAVGPARVVTDAADLASVCEGDILVARQTDPGWSPAFARLAGLVLETGGILAHGASLCREYGLPCVSIVERATTRLVTGDIVRISGSAGKVTVLEPAGNRQETR